MFDYVIVGGGSAGCAVARRLSDDPNIKVCLLEAGTPDKSPLVQMPAGVIAIMPTRYKNWAFETVPQAGLGGRKGYQPRGKVMGGSSSINAMLYIRGHATDYDEWAELGNDGWSYDDVLPYFKKSENHENGGDAYHGVGGPLSVTNLRSPNPVGQLFLDAGKELQLPVTDDFNGATQEGLSAYQVTQKDGQRCSAAKAYITPVLGRENLTVKTGAHATRILFEGKRATGIEYQRNGKTEQALASREVVLCGGAFQSPQLLMLSGVGPSGDIEKHGIELRHELPGVGQNLQDHIDFVSSFKSISRDPFGFSVRGTPKMIKALFQYGFKRKGPMTSPFAESGGFLKTDPSLDRPDIQLHFIVGIVDDHARKLHWGHGYSCHVCLLRPKSRGTVTLESADPLAPPRIDPQFFAEAEDMTTMVRGTKMMQRILAAPAFDAERGKELYPFDSDDDDVRRVLRQKADTVYHPVGTCKMGHDHMAVVDNELRVHGLEGLRVADASIMPTLVGGNTNAPTIMIGEKCADMIKANATV